MNINSILGNIIDGVYNGPSINQREKIYNDINAEIVVIATVLPEKQLLNLAKYLDLQKQNYKSQVL